MNRQVRISRTSSSGATNRRNRLYPTRDSASPPITIADVGVNRFIHPDADWYAVTTIARLTPAKSPSGAMIGIASVACPEEDGTKNASGMFTRYITTANAPDGSPDTTDSSPCSTESVIEALFMMVVTPRATAMISAAPMKSPAPEMIPVTVPSSPSPPTSPISTAPTRNNAASSGKYQPSVMDSREAEKSPHGITEKIISRKVSPKIHSTTFCRPVIGAGAPACSAASASSPSTAGTIDLAGSPLTRRAYHSTYNRATITMTTYMISRSPMPSPSATPAASEATPVANGLTVDASVPTPAPTMMIPTPTSRSYPRAMITGKMIA